MSDARDALAEALQKAEDQQKRGPGSVCFLQWSDWNALIAAARAQAKGGTMPREPTVAMCVAARDHIVLEDEDDDESDELAACIWRAMYDAAPRAGEGKFGPKCAVHGICPDPMQCEIEGRCVAKPSASEGKEPDELDRTIADARAMWGIPVDKSQKSQGQPVDKVPNPPGDAEQPAPPSASEGKDVLMYQSKVHAAAPTDDAALIAEIDDAMREQVSTTVRCLLRERLRTRLAQPADDPLPLSEWQRLQIEIATAQAELRTARAALESKDKALREIASIRPFGMISDAQIIASAALGDTQEPT